MIEGLTQEITGLIRKSEKKLQRLAAAGPSEDSNIRKNVQVSLNFLLEPTTCDHTCK
jgi:syntaxin 16